MVSETKSKNCFRNKPMRSTLFSYTNINVRAELEEGFEAENDGAE